MTAATSNPTGGLAPPRSACLPPGDDSPDVQQLNPMTPSLSTSTRGISRLPNDLIGRRGRVTT